MLVTLVELVPFDPVAGAAVTLRATSHNDAAATALNGAAWIPALASAGRYGQRLIDATFAGGLAARASGVSLDLSAFPNAARYIWGDKPARVYVGNLGDTWGSYRQIFDGLSGAASIAGGRVAVPLRVNDIWLGSPLLNAFYAGTGGIEGPASLKGVPKPLCIGAPQYVAPVLIDSVNNVWQFHGYGAAHGVAAALDRLVRYPPSVGDFASYAALIGATIAPGYFATCLAAGLVRLGAPATGAFTLLAEGDSGGVDGWVRTPGKIMKRLATIAGATSGQIDAASLAALDSAIPRNRSDYFSAAITAGDAIRAVAAECNAAAGVGLLGKLIAPRYAIGSSALTLRGDGAALPVVRAARVLEIGAPFWRQQLGALPAFFVHGVGDYAQTSFADLVDTPAALTDGRVEAALASGGQLKDPVVLDSNGAGRALAIGSSGGTARDGDVISFAPAWPAERLPRVLFGVGGDSSANGVFRADGLSASGFTAYLKRATGGTMTTRTDTGAASYGSAPTLRLHKSQAADAFDGLYKFSGSVTVSNHYNAAEAVWEAGSVTIGIYTNDGAGWVQRDTIIVGGGSGATSARSFESSISLTTLGQHAGEEFGASVIASDYGFSSLALASVVYVTATGVTYTSATPAGAPGVPFILIG